MFNIVKPFDFWKVVTDILKWEVGILHSDLGCM